MAYQRRYRTIVPLPVDRAGEDDTLVWLVRESFDRAAAADALAIVEFSDLGETAVADIPPKVQKQLPAGTVIADYLWRVFEGVGERPDA